MQRRYLGLEILAKSRLQGFTRTSSGTEEVTITAITAQSPNQDHAETGLQHHSGGRDGRPSVRPAINGPIFAFPWRRPQDQEVYCSPNYVRIPPLSWS